MHAYANIARIKRRAIWIGILGVAAIALGAWVFTGQVRSAFLQTKGTDLTRIATGIAKQISATEHASIKAPADASSMAYLRVTKVLEDYQRSNPSIISAYTMRITGDGASLIVSPPADTNRNHTIDAQLEQRDVIGTPLGQKPDTAMRGAAAGTAAANRTFTVDRWGTWLTACAPIPNSTAGIEAIACVDEDQASVEQSMLRMNAMAGTMAFVSALLLCGMLIGYVRMQTELGLRKTLEEEREAALVRFITAIEHMGIIAVQSFDRDGIIRVWNRVSEQIFGIPSAEAIGSDLSTILSQDGDASSCKKSIEQIYASRQAIPSRERTVISRDGTQRTLMSAMFPIVEGGEVGEVFCLDVDVTRERADRLELEKARDEVHTLKEELDRLRARPGQGPA